MNVAGRCPDWSANSRRIPRAGPRPALVAGTPAGLHGVTVSADRPVRVRRSMRGAWRSRRHARSELPAVLRSPHRPRPAWPASNVGAVPKSTRRPASLEPPRGQRFDEPIGPTSAGRSCGRRGARCRQFEGHRPLALAAMVSTGRECRHDRAQASRPVAERRVVRRRIPSSRRFVRGSGGIVACDECDHAPLRSRRS